MTGSLPLGATVTATHSDGHRLVGEVVGVGFASVALRVSGFERTLYLYVGDGWTVEQTGGGA